MFFFFSSRRRHTRLQGDWSSDVCSSDLGDGYGNAVGTAESGQVPGSLDAVNRGVELGDRDRKSTRLNSSHLVISYAVFCLKKKKQQQTSRKPPIASRLQSQIRRSRALTR